MIDSETLIRAAFNRLAARVTEKLITKASEASVIASEAPDLIKKEWESFKKEVIEEANRINNQNESSQEIYSDQPKNVDTTKDKIENIRTKIISLSKTIEVQKK